MAQSGSAGAHENRRVWQCALFRLEHCQESNQECDLVRIRILREAEIDLMEGFNFYELQQAGLGDYFLDALYADIDSLLISAGIHVVESDHHKNASETLPVCRLLHAYERSC